MRNILTALCATMVLLSAGACSMMHKNDPTTLPAGQYSRTQSSTNAAGTEVKKTTDTNVYYDQNGNKRAVQQTETSRDPKGLLNKSTTTTTRTYN